MFKLRRRLDTVHHSGELPALLRWEWVYRIDGGVLVAEYLWTLAGAWARSPEAEKGAWSTKRIGGFVLASRIRR